MYFYLFGFVAGVIAISQLPCLPEAWQLCVGSLLVVALNRIRQMKFLPGLCIGLVYASCFGYGWLSRELPESLSNHVFYIEGYVDSLPHKGSRSRRFLFQLTRSEPHIKAKRISLAWYQQPNDPTPQAGEIWSFKVKLLRPHGLVNPGLFDYQAWLLSKGIHATGFVMPDDNNNRRGVTPWHAFQHRLRETIHTRLDAYFTPDTQKLHRDTRGLLFALLIGESSGITPKMWQVLSDTGTNHLLIISGLHVGLVAALLFGLMSRVLKPLTEYWRTPTLMITLVGVVLYSFIVGFGLPVQRALVMTCIGMFALSSRRQNSTPLMVLFALVAVLIINPFASLSAGFWLSFGAVFALVLFFGGFSELRLSWLSNLLRTQWVVFVAIAPLLICWVFQVSIVSLLVNLFAIPFVSFVLIPLLLMLLVSLALALPLTNELLDLIMLLLGVMQRVLTQFAEMNFVFRHVEPNFGLLLLAMLGSCLILSPVGLRAGWLGLVCWLPIILPIEHKDDMLRLKILDVGQGLSVIVSRNASDLVYDTGPAYGRFDAGEQILFPTLSRLHQRDVDLLIISHSDLDHAGGQAGLNRRIIVDQTTSSDPLLGKPCIGNASWQFDGFSAEVLPVGIQSRGNNASCVILVKSQFGNILLPGDIEAEAELSLDKILLPVIDVMVAPHHGSQTSSSPAFINHVNPKIVVYSTGYKNRFGHPDKIVEDRYRNRKIQSFNTAHTGAVEIEFTAKGPVLYTARRRFSRFWYD